MIKTKQVYFLTSTNLVTPYFIIIITIIIIIIIIIIIYYYYESIMLKLFNYTSIHINRS